MHSSKIESAAASLVEDLKSQDTKIKINAIKSLSVIALTIGKERTRNELLPYLSGKARY
jgi:serine/threonine-protein phosphatase 2A regulatory subunit A